MYDRGREKRGRGTGRRKDGRVMRERGRFFHGGLMSTVIYIAN